MNKKDARFLPSVIQQKLRHEAVNMFLKGVKKVDIARQLCVSRKAVYKWIKTYSKSGKNGLKIRKRGRPKGCVLEPWQSAQIVKIVKDYCPDDLSMPFFLWTRDAISELIQLKFNIKLSRWTVGKYLKKWGFSPQKPISRAIEQDPKAIENWFKVEYPSIQKLSKKENATIYWGDEMGLRSDHNVGRTFGKKGKTPIVKRTGNRFSYNMISAITNLGKLSFMIFKESFDQDVFIKFLKRLIRQYDKKVFLIVDNHPSHKSRKVKNWLIKHEKHIKLFHLPSYCPELNPDEFLNQDVKSHIGKRRPQTQSQMKKNLESYLKMRQKQPHIIQNFVKGCNRRYAR
jgi:transposase